MKKYFMEYIHAFFSSLPHSPQYTPHNYTVFIIYSVIYLIYAYNQDIFLRYQLYVKSNYMCIISIFVNKMYYIGLIDI